MITVSIFCIEIFIFLTASTPTLFGAFPRIGANVQQWNDPHNPQSQFIIQPLGKSE